MTATVVFLVLAALPGELREHQTFGARFALLTGLLLAAVVLAVAVGVLAGARYARWYWVLLWLGTAAGSVFTLWLWWQTTFHINALCLFCMIVWCAQTLLLAHTTARMRQAGILGSSPRGMDSGLSAWAWFSGIAALVVVFGVIAVRFATVIFG